MAGTARWRRSWWRRRAAPGSGRRTFRQGLDPGFLVVEPRAQCLPRRRRQPHIADHDGAFAGVDPRLVDRGVEIHSVVHHEGKYLRHRRQDAPAAGGADRDAPAIGRLRQHRCVVGQATLARRQRVRRARCRIEPHDAVVHGDAGLRRDEFGAEARQQGLRHRGHVAFAVDRREMRGAGRRQRFCAERAAAVGVAHVLEAFAVGRLQRRRVGDVGRQRPVRRATAANFAAAGVAYAPASVRRSVPASQTPFRRDRGSPAARAQRCGKARGPRSTTRRRRPAHRRRCCAPDRPRRNRAGLAPRAAPSSP